MRFKPIPATLLCAALASSAGAASISVQAYDSKGRLLDTQALLKHIAPQSLRETGISPQKSGLYLTALDGGPVDGSPWWDEASETPVWRWENADNVRISLPWPVPNDGFSHAQLDDGDKGYADGQTILLNEEIAKTAYRHFQQALKKRRTLWKPSYQPGKQAQEFIKKSKSLIAEATAVDDRRERAKLFDKALSHISYTWQQVLVEHGRQTFQDPKRGRQQRWGLTLDETVIQRPKDYDWLAEKIQDSGTDWVRIVFGKNSQDFSYSRRRSLVPYDELLTALKNRNIRVMGSVLDSMLWPKDLTPELYRERVRNLVLHYKDSIRSWEIASEPNGNWIGGTRKPVAPEEILLSVQKAMIEVKRIDPALETVATLHWWEGTAPEEKYTLFGWLRWALPRGFGKGIDVIAVSVYPHRNPLGYAFDPVFFRLRELFPSQKLMLGGWSFADGKKLQGYWWLEPENVRGARKDLAVLFSGAQAAIPGGVGGGFYWPTLEHMLLPRKRTPSLFGVYRRAIKRIRDKK